MKYISFKKIFAICIIVAFFGISIKPAIASSSETFLVSSSDLITIKNVYYKPDGTIEEIFIELLQQEAVELKKQLLKAETIEERIIILQKFGLVLQDLNLSDWEEGMHQKAERMGLTTDIANKIQPRSNISGLCLNFFCDVFVLTLVAINIKLGLNIITGILNMLLTAAGINFSNLIPSIDLADFGFALMGEFETIGLLGNQSLIGENGIYLMLFGLLGFVGVHIYCPSIVSFWTGFSVMALGHASNSDK